MIKNDFQTSYQVTIDDIAITKQLKDIGVITTPKTAVMVNTHHLKGSHRKVYPIKSIDTISQVKSYLLSRPERYKGTNIFRYTFFCFGINQILRMSDLHKLKISDVSTENGEIKDYLIVDCEEKTGKRNVIYLNKSIKSTLLPYLEYRRIDGTYDYNAPLFLNRNGKALSRQSAWEYMKDIQNELDIKFPMGSHSLRKTCAYQMWKNGTDVYVVSNALNHSDLNVTKRYVTIDEDETTEAYKNNCL